MTTLVFFGCVDIVSNWELLITSMTLVLASVLIQNRKFNVFLKKEKGLSRCETILKIIDTNSKTNGVCSKPNWRWSTNCSNWKFIWVRTLCEHYVKTLRWIYWDYFADDTNEVVRYSFVTNYYSPNWLRSYFKMIVTDYITTLRKWKDVELKKYI